MESNPPTFLELNFLDYALTVTQCFAVFVECEDDVMLANPPKF